LPECFDKTLPLHEYFMSNIKMNKQNKHYYPK